MKINQYIMSTMAATLDDIARQAGVSIATVSMALNQKKGVSRSKAEEIRRIAQELGYQKRQELDLGGRPLRFVQILQSTDSWDDTYRIFIAEYLEGITTVAAAHGISVDVQTFMLDDIKAGGYRENGQEDIGTIFLGAGLYRKDVERLHKVDPYGIFIDVCYYGINATFVDIDNAESIYQIVSHLVDKGHTRIGFIQADRLSPNFQAREQAYKEAIRLFDLAYDEKMVLRIAIDREQGKLDLIDHLKKKEDRADAFLCANDILAYNGINACRELGLSVPGDIALVGFDDLPASKEIIPTLTTVRVSRKSIAAQAFHHIIGRHTGLTTPPPEKILIAGRLIEREST